MASPAEPVAGEAKVHPAGRVVVILTTDDRWRDFVASPAEPVAGEAKVHPAGRVVVILTTDDRWRDFVAAQRGASTVKI